MKTKKPTITYTYKGDGVSKNFPILWPYLDRSFVHISLHQTLTDHVHVQDITATVRWLSASQIEVLPPPPQETTLVITRKTPNNRALTVFKDGSTSLAADLNQVSTQLIHITEESRDYTELVHTLVHNASGLLHEFKNLSIVADAVPYGQMTAATYNPEIGKITLYIPEGKQGRTGPPGLTGSQGEKGNTGERGMEGPPGPPGQALLVDVITCGGACDAAHITTINGGTAFDFRSI